MKKKGLTRVLIKRFRNLLKEIFRVILLVLKWALLFMPFTILFPFSLTFLFVKTNFYLHMFALLSFIASGTAITFAPTVINFNSGLLLKFKEWVDDVIKESKEPLDG